MLVFAGIPNEPAFMANPASSTFLHWARGLRFPVLFMLTAGVLLLDLLLPDPIPFVDEVLIGLACILLCLILMLPIPGGNFVPSLIIAAFGFGLMQRDGALILAAWLGTAGFAAFIWLAWEVVSRVIGNSWAWVIGLF